MLWHMCANSKYNCLQFAQQLIACGNSRFSLKPANSSQLLNHFSSYNTQLLLAFLNTLYRDLILEQERGLVRPHLSNYVVVWDNVSFHRTNIVRDWFAAHERITVEFLPPYSPFINPIEEFFSVWRWKVYDHRPQDQMSLLGAMNAVCEDISADHRRGWRFPPRCMPMENIRCDVDGNLWPDQQERQDVHHESFFSLMLFCSYFVFLVTRNMKCTVIGQVIFHFRCNTFVQK